MPSDFGSHALVRASARDRWQGQGQARRSQSLAPRRTDRTTHTWRASAGEIAPTLGSDLIVWASCTPARICFNHQARRGTDTVSPRLLTAPFNRFGKLMATCFKRQIQTSANISPMCSKTISLPHWSLMKGAGDPWWTLRARLGGCSLPGVVWSGVARQRGIRNAIAYLCFSTDCACGQQLDATHGSKPLRCETHPLTRCVTCQHALPNVKPVGVQKRARRLHSRASKRRSV